jgi:hypothetical protein
MYQWHSQMIIEILQFLHLLLHFLHFKKINNYGERYELQMLV